MTAIDNIGQALAAWDRAQQTLDQIRAGIRHDARGMDADRARNRSTAASIDAAMHLIRGNVTAHIDASTAADEWDRIAAERRADA